MGIVGDSDESAGKRRMKSTRMDAEGVPSSITSARIEKRMDWRGTTGDTEAEGGPSRDMGPLRSGRGVNTCHVVAMAKSIALSFFAAPDASFWLPWQKL